VGETLGVLEAETVLAACAVLLGLRVETAGGSGPSALVERAIAEGWPLLGGSARSLTSLPSAAIARLATFVRGGGTLFVSDVRAGTVLPELSRRLGLEPLQALSPSQRATALLFPAGAVDYAGILAGVALDTSIAGTALSGSARPLGLSTLGTERHPALVEVGAGEGCVILSGFPSHLPGELAACFGAEFSPVLVPPMMALRRAYGGAAWHPPALLANFTVDDPALREGLLGFPYSRAVDLARRHGFHVTVATIPAELHLAEPAVVSQLQSHPLQMSACYHGWDHDGYEFYRSSGRHLRFRVRSLYQQRAALGRATEAGQRFAGRTGYALDRVMVFPHGLGPAAILPELADLGFVASCNLDNRYPLEAELPQDPFLGLRPADTAWHGFPLLWRREISDPAFALDLFLGRPAMTFEHRPALRLDLLPFRERAEEIHRLTGGQVAWRSLEEIARHAYWQRFDPAAGWQVLVTANEACLHNQEPVARSYRILRPHRLPSSVWEAAGGEVAEGQDGMQCVTVPPGGVVTIKLSIRGSARGPVLPSRGLACSLLGCSPA
jgi:hypothetical protein